jgi:DNA-binding NarL/FixJ family response regulator
MPTTILIADDHGVLRAGLRALLSAERDFEVVGEAASGTEALRLAERLRPDVVLIDIGLPDMDGLEATRQLLARPLGTRVLVLTVHEDEALVREALHSGAAGYVVKRAVESELIDAIRAVAAGHLYVHPALTRALISPNRAPAAGPPTDCLTPREVQVLQLVAQGYTNCQIAEMFSLSVRTVESHRARLRAKLDLRSRADLVRYATGLGLLAPGPRKG